MKPEILVLSTYADRDLAEAIAESGGYQLGRVHREAFPDGEVYHRIDTPLSGRHVAIIGATADDASTLELYDLACGAAKHGAATLTLVVPYFGYSTMERAVKPGELVKAKTRARLLSAIPIASSGNRVVLVDLHVDGITHYFEGAICPVHVYAKPVVTAAMRRIAGDAFILACTDAGRAKWVESLASELKTSAAFVYKRRLDGEHTEITGVSASVNGRDVVIYDDMIRTGGSLIQAARAYKSAGAQRIWAFATHGIFPGNALERLSSSGLFERIVTTDSHPRARQLAGGPLEVLSIAGLLAEHIIERSTL